MQRLAASLLVPLCLAAAPPGDEEEQDDTVAVSGRVVDADGRPVADVNVSANWSGMTMPLPSAMGGFTSDADGAFAGDMDIYRYPGALAAYTADGSLAGWTAIEEGATGELLIELSPSVRVFGEVGRSDEDVPLESATFSFDIGRAISIYCGLQGGGEFEYLLPRADVQWMAYDSFFSMVTGEVELAEDQAEVDLGRIDIPAAFLAKQVGKLLPEWTVSDARNVPLDQASLAAHRGKWLLIEFWGFW